MSIESDLTPENVKNPQRRTMMKAAAWAAPVVAIAATAPLAAASNTPPQEWGADISITNNLRYQSTTEKITTGLSASIDYYGADQWTPPAITATYTVGGYGDNWSFTRSAGTTGDITVVGGSVTRAGLTWTVISVTATQLVLQFAAGRIDGDGILAVPGITVSGEYTGDGSSAQQADATISVSGIPQLATSVTSRYPN